MLKLTITGNGKTLTLYVANNAFDGIEPAILPEEQVIILKKLASKMMRNAKFMADRESETIYLREIKFNQADSSAAKLFYLKQSDKYAIAQTPNAANIRNQEPVQLAGYEVSVQAIGEIPAEITFIENKILFQNELPPIVMADTTVVKEPVDVHKFPTTVQLLMQKNKCTEKDAIEQTIEIFGDLKTILTEIKDRDLTDSLIDPTLLPEGYLERLDQLIESKLANNQYNNTKKVFVDALEAHLNARSEYIFVQDSIAASLYAAAKQYYIAIWQANRNNPDKLIEARNEFNKLFKDIASINDDFSFSPFEKTKEVVRLLDPDALDSKLSTLVNSAYQGLKKPEFTMFETAVIKSNPNTFYNISASMTLTGWVYKFNSPVAHHTYQSYKQAQASFDDYPVRYLNSEVTKHVELSKQELRKHIQDLKTDHPRAFSTAKPATPRKARGADQQPEHANAKPPTRNFWQRNKATMISIGLGVLAAAAIAVAIVLTVGTGGTMPFIIAGAAAAAVGISVIVGRVADYFRGRKQQREAANAETASLLSQDDLDTPPPSPTLGTSAKVARATGGISAAFDGRDDDSGLSFGAGKPGPMFAEESAQTNNKSATPAPVSGQNNNNARK